MKNLDKAINKLRAEKMENFTLKDVATMVWPDMAQEAARGKLSRIVNGHAKHIDVDFPERIAKVCGVSIPFLYGEEFTSNELSMLKKLLRDKFDAKESETFDREKCWSIISLAKKLSLPKDYIEELESDYSFEFNVKL